MRYEISDLLTELESKNTEIERLRAALKFYADEENWDDLSSPWDDDSISHATQDGGEIARKALNQQKAGG